MVRGINGNAEESIYTYNGLGALMENTWIIAKNGYGYHDVSGEEDATTPTDPTPDVPDPGETTDPEDPDPGETTDPDVPDPGETTDPETPDDGDDSGINNNGNGNNNGNNGNHYGNGNGNGNGNGSNSADSTETTAADAGVLTASLVVYGNAGNGNNGNNGNGNGNQDKPTGSDVKNTSTVIKRFVVDFSSETFRPLMEHEVNGLDYRYVYSDKARLSVVVQGIENGSASLLDDKGELHAYYHCDYLGTTDYLTSAVNSKVISWTSYSEWGEITHNAVLKCGQRELDLVKEYATHDFDAVLNMYYAKARFYDADNRQFVSVDPILDPSQYDLREYVKEPMALVQYLYVRANAVNLVDLLGLVAGDLIINGVTISHQLEQNGTHYASVRDLASAYEITKLRTFRMGDNTTYYVDIGDLNESHYTFWLPYESSTYYEGQKAYVSKYPNRSGAGRIVDSINYTIVPDRDNPGYKKIVVDVDTFMKYVAKKGVNTNVEYDLGDVGGTWTGWVNILTYETRRLIPSEIVRKAIEQYDSTGRTDFVAALNSAANSYSSYGGAGFIGDIIGTVIGNMILKSYYHDYFLNQQCDFFEFVTTDNYFADTSPSNVTGSPVRDTSVFSFNGDRLKIVYINVSGNFYPGRY